MSVLELTGYANIQPESFLIELVNLLGDRLESLDIHPRPGLVTVIFTDEHTIADEAAVTSALNAHDPVFITAKRSSNEVTVTLTKPRNLDKTTELTLTIDDTPAPSAITLTDNKVSVMIQSEDEITIGIAEDYPHQEVTI
ncbi:hypothetical protein ACFLYO_00435 [Chloroflexota bacterium]